MELRPHRRPEFQIGGALNALAGYSGSEVLDEHRVTVQFKKPYAPFLTAVAGGTLSLVSPRAVKERGDNFGQRPVGTGVFAVAEYIGPKPSWCRHSSVNWASRPTSNPRRGRPGMRITTSA
jgi:hypothetical protein